MIRIFHVHFAAILLMVAAVDAVLFYVAIDVSVEMSRRGPSSFLGELADFSAQKALFVVAMMTALFSMGVYSDTALSQPRELARDFASPGECESALAVGRAQANENAVSRR